MGESSQMRTSNSSIPDLVSFPYVLNSLAVGLVHILILTGSYPDTRSFSAASGFLLQTRWPTLAPTPTAPNFSCVSLKQPGWTENTVRCFLGNHLFHLYFTLSHFHFFFNFPQSSLAPLSRVWMLSRQLKPLVLNLVPLVRRSSLLPVDSFKEAVVMV